MRARHEGARFDSDVFLIEDGILPADVMEAALVKPTRFDPETYVPPRPGQAVRRAEDDERDRALAFDGMDRRLAAGLSRDEQALFVNLDFVDGSRGAHINISGVSGVATKTTYATFLLYSLFTSGSLGAEAANTRALIFNVKGEDLLFLDHPNTKLVDEDRARYAPAWPAGRRLPRRRGVGPAPPRFGHRGARRDQPGRGRGAVLLDDPGLLRRRAAALPVRRCRGRPPAVHDHRGQRRSTVVDRGQTMGEGGIRLEGDEIRTFRQLVEKLADLVDGDEEGFWAGRAIGSGTKGAFTRRLFASRSSTSNT